MRITLRDERGTKTLGIAYVIIIGCLLTLMFTGCSAVMHDFKLDSGETVTCSGKTVNACGVRLWNCTNDKAYVCQINVEQM